MRRRPLSLTDDVVVRSSVADVSIRAQLVVAFGTMPKERVSVDQLSLFGEPGGGSDAAPDSGPHAMGAAPNAIDPSPPIDPSLASRCEAVVLAAAIGDAMGHPTEFMSMSEIERRFGPSGVTGFELYRERNGERFAPYTDDTQMAEVVLRSLLASREADESLDATMARMAGGFVEWAEHPQGGHRAPGNACLSGCRELARGTHWSLAGGETAGGCGSVMRAYPFGLVFRDDLALAARIAVEHSKLTHRDPIALAASGAMAVGVALALRGDPADAVARAMIVEAARHSEKTAEMMQLALDEAVGGVSPRVTLDRLRGWAAHEAIAAAVYIFVRHPDDARAAILEGANTPGDSDSLATLAGALVGARVGLEGIPDSWIADVERSAELSELAGRILPGAGWSTIANDP